MNTDNLVLYHFEACPYCRRVRDYLAQAGIHVEMKDTREDPTAREELRELGGKTQVPALLIDGQIMYESNDIISWFKQYVENNEPVSG